MTPEQIGLVVGLVIAFALEYVPKLKDWYAKQEEIYKKLIAIGIGFVVVGVAFGLGCFELLSAYWPCTWPGAYQAFLAWGAYVLANQTTYALLLNRKKK